MISVLGNSPAEKDGFQNFGDKEPKLSNKYKVSSSVTEMYEQASRSVFPG
jgi:hypothetical protein